MSWASKSALKEADRREWMLEVLLWPILLALARAAYLSDYLCELHLFHGTATSMSYFLCCLQRELLDSDSVLSFFLPWKLVNMRHLPCVCCASEDLAFFEQLFFSFSRYYDCLLLVAMDDFVVVT